MLHFFSIMVCLVMSGGSHEHGLYKKVWHWVGEGALLCWRETQGSCHCGNARKHQSQRSVKAVIVAWTFLNEPDIAVFI